MARTKNRKWLATCVGGRWDGEVVELCDELSFFALPTDRPDGLQAVYRQRTAWAIGRRTHILRARFTFRGYQ